MGALTKGYTFGATEQVTSTKLHNLVDSASLNTAAADGSTLQVVSMSGTNKMKIKDSGVGTTQLADNSVTGEKVDSTDSFNFNAVQATTCGLDAYSFTTDSSTLAPNLALGNFQILTIDRNVTSVSALANMSAGKQFTFIIKNGNFNVTGWDTTWKWFGDAEPDVTAVSAGTATDILSGVTDGTNAYVTLLKNFA
jgi:hypothetical protein